MQIYANVVFAPERKTSKTSGGTYWSIRVAESKKGEAKSETTFFTVRLMREEDPGLKPGDFVKVTGKLKPSVYMDVKQNKPAVTLYIHAFEAKMLPRGTKNPEEATSPQPEPAEAAEKRPPRAELEQRQVAIPVGNREVVVTTKGDHENRATPRTSQLEVEVDDSYLQLVA